MKGKLMKIINIFFLLMLFLLIITPAAYTKDMLEDLLPPDENCSLLFPETFIMRGFAYTYNCEVSGPIEITIHNKPGADQIYYTVSSPLTKAELVYDRHLNIMRSETVLYNTIQKKIDKIGQDKRYYHREYTENGPDTIILTAFYQGKVKKKKKFSCDRNVFPSDTVMMMLHTLLLKGEKKDFLFDIISLEDAVKVRMKISYYLTDKVISLSEDFPFPDTVTKAIQPGKTYHVFEMKTHGMIRLFVRSSWFFVFEEKYPYGYTAYWGGEGLFSEIMFFPENEYTGGRQ
jgi:hypothetical protein